MMCYIMFLVQLHQNENTKPTNAAQFPVVYRSALVTWIVGERFNLSF